jgi:putative ABC transport system ATP-binding protein
MDLMQQLNRERGRTLVVVTHDRRLANSRADRVVYLFDGRLYDVPPDDF